MTHAALKDLSAEMRRAVAREQAGQLAIYDPSAWADKLDAALSAMEGEAVDPIGWVYQHEETGQMTFCTNDGINTPEVFQRLNPRHILCGAAYTAPPPQQAAPQQESNGLSLHGDTNGQALAWQAVYNALVEADPEFHSRPGTGKERALASVRALATQPQQAGGDAVPAHPRYHMTTGHCPNKSAGSRDCGQHNLHCNWPKCDQRVELLNPTPPPPAPHRPEAQQPEAGGGEAEPNMRHPKIQSLIGANARLGIELSLIESLLFDPEFEMCGSDWDYETELVTKVIELRNKLSAISTPPQPEAKYVTPAMLADALDCFWNAAMNTAIHSQDSTALSTVSAVVEGIAAVANRLREHSTTPASGDEHG